MNQDDIVVLERIARAAPFQHFGQSAVKDNGSEKGYFFLPFVGFVKIEINFRIHLGHFEV